MNSISSSHWDNPYQAPQMLVEPEPDYFPRRNYFWLKLWISLQMFVIVGALSGSFVNIYSIIWTGPVLAVVGFLVLTLAYRMRSWWGMALGSSGPMFSLFIFLLINVEGWGPDQASKPVPILGAAYFVITAMIALIVFLKMRSRETAWQSTPPESPQRSVR